MIKDFGFVAGFVHHPSTILTAQEYMQDSFEQHNQTITLPNYLRALSWAGLLF
jgi:hypothetical protein